MLDPPGLCVTHTRSRGIAAAGHGVLQTCLLARYVRFAEARCTFEFTLWRKLQTYEAELFRQQTVL